MARFQAQTNAVLDAELESLQTTLGLRAHQKADLLRELTALATWVVRQAEQGRAIVAQGDDQTQTLHHPALERIRHQRRQVTERPARIELSDDETRSLAAILDRGFDPPPALVEALARLADPDRAAPALRWPDT